MRPFPIFRHAPCPYYRPLASADAYGHEPTLAEVQLGVQSRPRGSVMRRMLVHQVEKRHGGTEFSLIPMYWKAGMNLVAESWRGRALAHCVCRKRVQELYRSRRCRGKYRGPITLVVAAAMLAIINSPSIKSAEYPNNTTLYALSDTQSLYITCTEADAAHISCDFNQVIISRASDAKKLDESLKSIDELKDTNYKTPFRL